MKQHYTWIITVLLVLGSAKNTYSQITAKQFANAQAKVLTHVKQRIDETLYFEVTEEELSSLGDTGKSISDTIKSLLETWGILAFQKDSLEKDLHGRWTDMPFDKNGPIAIIWDTIARKDSSMADITQALLESRKQFADLLWRKLFKFPIEMKTFLVSTDGNQKTKKTQDMAAYLSFIWTFDSYCGERLQPRDGPRGITVAGNSEKVVLVF